MILTLALLLAGLLLIIFGADALVDGASVIARKLGISEFVIGLTIVGFGTSCPELVVSLNGAFQGISDIALGNVVGSNIFNTLLILGITALMRPIAITQNNRKRDIPIAVLATVTLLVFGFIGHEISRFEAIVMLFLFAAYLWSCFKFDKADTNDKAETETPEPITKGGVVKAILFVAGGLAGLIFGGDLFVKSATEIAHKLGVSEKIIAITLLAGGTSFPELATCIVAAAKHKDQLALGNILGSNVFNILLILGTSAMVHPLSFININLVDAAVLLASIMLIWASTFTGRTCKIDRWEGVLMLLCFAGYYVWLFTAN